MYFLCPGPRCGGTRRATRRPSPRSRPATPRPAAGRSRGTSAPWPTFCWRTSHSAPERRSPRRVSRLRPRHGRALRVVGRWGQAALRRHRTGPRRASSYGIGRWPFSTKLAGTPPGCEIRRGPSSVRRPQPLWAGRTHVDAWGLLDICQSPDILDAIEALIGPNIVLWESELILQVPGLPAKAAHHDPDLWPIDPPACHGAHRHHRVGSDGRRTSRCAARRPGGRAISVRPAGRDFLRKRAPFASHEFRGTETGAEYLIRYMPAGARYVRDADFPANRRATQKAPLINFARRPIWLVRGEDLAGNDFVTGFAATVGQWAGARW